jgi:hypothetical protein
MHACTNMKKNVYWLSMLEMQQQWPCRERQLAIEAAWFDADFMINKDPGKSHCSLVTQLICILIPCS